MDRVNFRVCTPPSFGKDGVVDICGHLIGSAATVENATRAKLEYMTVLKLLAVNEVVDISAEKWRETEQFLLQVGAMKPSVTKTSRGVAGVGEILDISNLSITLMYNDIDRYPAKKKFFDEVCSDQLKDRFLPIRLYGALQEDFNSMKDVNAQEFVINNKQLYEDLIRTFTYYCENYHRELKKFSAEKFDKELRSMRGRWRINIARIMKFIDLYSDDQQEFNKWVALLLEANNDYLVMTEFPVLLEQSVNKGKVVGKEKHDSFLKRLFLTNTFSDKKKVINSFLADKQAVSLDKDLWKWGDK
jgi:hypothetical protein